MKGQVDNLLVSVSHTTHLHLPDKQVHSLKVIHHCCSDPNVNNYVDLYTEVVSSSKGELWVVASRFLLDV